jgi:cell division control protein 45
MYLPRALIAQLYNNLLRSHHPQSAPVLILVALEPDAICACKILTSLLKRDYITHKVQPVSGYADLAKAGQDLVQPMKTTNGGTGGVVICLGVGGLVDLGELLGLEDAEDGEDAMGGVECWVMDARRPWNLSNAFGGQPSEQPLGETDGNTTRRSVGIEKGCIQRHYRPGKGGIVVFDDGEIADDLTAERDAYCALAEMPEVEDEEDSDDEEVESSQPSSPSRKRKSWDRENDNPFDEDSDDERPRQRRRSGSGSSIASIIPRSQHSSSNSLPPSSPPPKVAKAPSARQLRQKLRKLRQSHEAVLSAYYSLGTSYSEPISSLVYSLASELGREDNDLLWLATVGVTSLELSGHTSTGLGASHAPTTNLQNPYHQSWRATRSSRTYALLRDEVRRLNPPPHDQSPSLSPTFSSTSSPTDTSIRLSPDPRFLLLRHWSLYDSMMHSPYLAARLRIWNDGGVKRLHKLLAKMGVSLTQCKQGYTHMDMELKKSLRDRLLKYAGVYALEGIVPEGSGRAAYEQEGWGFIRSWGWKAQLSAVDVGVILGAILEVGSSQPTSKSAGGGYNGSTQQTTQADEPEDRSVALVPRFFAAYDALDHPSQLLSAVPIAQHLLRSIHRTGSALMQKDRLRHLRAFRMGVVKDGPDLGLFSSSPGALVKLALWVGEAVAISSKDVKDKDGRTPLVLAALDDARGTYIIVGTGGGIGGGVDMEARKEKAEAKNKKNEERNAKRKAREEKKAAKAGVRAARELDDESDEEEEEEEEEEESDASDSESENEDDAEEQAKLQKRGYGRNRFGIAFQEVVEETNARVKIDSFDHCVVEVKKEDLGGFLEGLSLKSVVGK